MDSLAEDNVLTANLGRYTLGPGLDNDVLDFSQLEAYINNDAGLFNFPDDIIPTSHSYTNGHAMDCSGGKTAVPQQVHQHLSPHSHPNQYCNPATGQMTKNHPFCHPQLPDSPPDSGSEPYSPPDGNQVESSCKLKENHVGSINNISQSVYGSQSSQTHNSNSPQHLPHSSPPSQGLPPQSQGLPPSSHLEKQEPYPMYALHHHDTSRLNPMSLPISSVPPNTHMSPQMMPHQFPGMNNLMNHQNKKRKYSDSPNNTITPNSLPHGIMSNLNSMMSIKQEPLENCHHIIMPHGVLTDCVEEDYPYDLTSDASSYMDGVYQVIKWQTWNPQHYCTLLDANFKELTQPSYRVDADKGFNFSVPDESFVCQKKNHFQVTVHIGITGEPRYVKTSDGTKKIESFHLHFYGVKSESPTQTIKVEQSQSDRSKKAFYPVKIDLLPDQVTKVTVGRLHFSETTSNNMRKKGKPNPDQRYFMLVIALEAHSTDNVAMIAAQASERIIVRASNPGQFDNDVDVLWQKGHTPESVYHAGRVGINTDRPDEALTVHGNIKLTGHIMQPSDQRVKKNIQELDPKEQLKKVSLMKVYKYEYDDDFVEHMGFSDEETCDTGVMAQELREVLPDAVRESGNLNLGDDRCVENFLVVNKDRLYMENVGAVKELCKLTDNLENRIDELEKMNKKLSKLKRFDSMKSTFSNGSNFSRCGSALSANSKKPEVNNNNNKKVISPSGNPGSGGGSNLKLAEEFGCSNRFIQFTIVALVLVMAFCLVSITTLYIMEKQNPSIADPGYFANFSSNDTLDNETFPSTTLSPHYYNGVKMLIPPRCIRSRCDVFCCLKSDPKQDDYGLNSDSKKSLNPDGKKGYQYNDRHYNDKDTRHKDSNSLDHIDRNKTYEVNVPMETFKNKRPTYQDDYNSYDYYEHDTDNTKYLNDNDFATDYNNNEYPKYEDRSHDSYTVEEMKVKRHVAKNRRSIDPEEAPIERPELKAEIKIDESNENIDSSMCADEACRSGLGGNYTYHIPISRHFPIAHIIIQLKVAEGLKVTLCSRNQIQQCDLQFESYPSMHTVNTKDTRGWDLPVGYYSSSSYKFRIFYDLNDKAACLADYIDIGKTFAEYNLHFFRVCSTDTYDE